jgi:hypothetical protein
VCVIELNRKINTVTTKDYENKASVVSRLEILLQLNSFFASDDEIIKLACSIHESGIGTRV